MASHPRASEAVRDEWLRRVQAEYTSAAITQHLGLWLIQIGASPDLIKAALRIVTDELEHARLSHVVYLRAGGTGAPRLERDHLEIRRTQSAAQGGHHRVMLESDVARTALAVFCLGETVAVPLFRGLREECSVPSARRALDRILRDEVRHRDFGWLLLDWLLEQPCAADVRAIASAELPAMFARVAEQYSVMNRDRSTAIDPDDRAWGLMREADYAAAVFRALDRDWAPRFNERGIDARAAWDRGVGVASTSAEEARL